MFDTGSCLMHKSEGVCVVEGVRTESFGGVSRDYYILRPLYENTATTVFLPIESADKRLRALLTREEWGQLLREAKTQSFVWEANDRTRQELFQQQLRACETSQLLDMLCALYQRRKELMLQGKKLRFFDEHTLQECERLLSEEYVHAWGVEKKEALSSIRAVTEW